MAHTGGVCSLSGTRATANQTVQRIGASRSAPIQIASQWRLAPIADLFVMSKTTKTVLIAVPVILILLAIAIPNFIPPHSTLSTNACANNLRWLQKAKAKWARNLTQPSTAAPTENDLRPVLKDLGAGDFFP